MFCQISQNWRTRSLIDLEKIIELIGNRTITTGLKIKTKFDYMACGKGRKISRLRIAIPIKHPHSDFHGEWNYTIRPNTQHI